MAGVNHIAKDIRPIKTCAVSVPTLPKGSLLEQMEVENQV